MRFNYTVVAKTVENRDELMDSLREQNVIIRRVYTNLPRHFVIYADRFTIAKLREDDRIECIVVESDFKSCSSQTIDGNYYGNWGLDRIDQRGPINVSRGGVYTYTRTGNNVDVIIMDSGIKFDFEEFQGRAIPHWDYRASMIIGGTMIYFPYGADALTCANLINGSVPGVASVSSGVLCLNPGNRFIDNGAGLTFIQDAFGIEPGTYSSIIGSKPVSVYPSWYGVDDFWHGSHVAGIIGSRTYGVAKASQLVSFKCFTSTGTASTITIIDCMDAAIDFHVNKTSGRPTVVNMSFGGPSDSSMNSAVIHMIQAGITCCIAAGNSSSDAGMISPASAGTTKQSDGTYTFSNKPIVVSSCNENDEFSYFSNFSDNTTLAGSGNNNFGSVVDIIAPGSSITSVGLAGPRIGSGTSMATPHVAGVCALILEDGNITPAQVRERIIGDATSNAIRILNTTTPNRLLYQPFNNSSIWWGTPSGSVGSYDEGSPVSIPLQAYARDAAGNLSRIWYNVSPSKPLPGSTLAISNILGLALDGDTGILHGTMPMVDHDISYSFTIYAVDDTGNSSGQIFSITSHNINNPPEWITPQGHLGTFTEGDAVSVMVIAHDSDPNSALQYSLLNGSLPPGINIATDTGEVYGSILNVSDDHIYTFTLRVSDRTSYADRTFTMGVAAKNEAPYWNQEWLPPQQMIDGHLVRSFGTFNIGDLVDIKIMAIDPDYDAMTFTIANPEFTPVIYSVLGSLPDGLTMDHSRGRITGVVSPKNSSGRYYFAVHVSDGHHHLINNVMSDEPLKENFFFTITDTTSTVLVRQGISFLPDNNPQVIASILGGSRITRITAQVSSTFNGINPRMRIGDTANLSRLMNFNDANLLQAGDYTSNPNNKYNQVGTLDLMIDFQDDSAPPQYSVSIRNTQVTTISILFSGTGFRAAPTPRIRFGGGNGAKAVSFLKAISCRCAVQGTGYRIGDILRIIGGSCQPTGLTNGNTTLTVDQSIKINVTGVSSSGAITSFAMAESGSYLVAPDNPAISDAGHASIENNSIVWSGTTGQGARFILDFGIKEVVVTDGGTGYLSPPSIEFSGNGITSGSVNLEIEYVASDVTVFFGNIKWITPSGLIGYIYETYPCPFSVKAIATGDSPITYTTAPGSGPMPIGLTIDSSTGEIRGSCGFTDNDTTYTFTIRASVGATFVDRTFSIIMKNLFNSKPVTGLYMALTGWDKKNMLEFASNIPNEYLFRPNDQEYGIVHNPMMYLLFGLPDVDDLTFWKAITGRQNRPWEYDYHRNLNVIVGDLKIAVARGLNGEVIYEVLYREIVDPLWRVRQKPNRSPIEVIPGGFKKGESLERQQVTYPEANSPNNRNDIQYLYPTSLLNMRKDLMAMDEQGLGIQGEEALPLWMRSEQQYGNPHSIPGYVPAVVVAYLTPGSGTSVLRHLNQVVDIDTVLGTKLLFDRYFMVKFDSTETMFDDGVFVPDGDFWPEISTDDANDQQVFAISNNLYRFGDVDHNPLTPNTFDLQATINDINARALVHAHLHGRAEPQKSQFQSENDYRVHENPDGAETTFDSKATLFDYQIFRTGKYFKLPPGDKP